MFSFQLSISPKTHLSTYNQLFPNHPIGESLAIEILWCGEGLCVGVSSSAAASNGPPIGGEVLARVTVRRLVREAYGSYS